MSAPLLCAGCLAVMNQLLDERIRAILRVMESEQAFMVSRGVEVNELDDGRAHCFHFMEIRAAINGEKTSGVFDKFGEPPTITGPLFTEAKS